MTQRGSLTAVKSLLGLVLGAGISYCVYRMIFAKEKKKSPAGAQRESKRSLLDKVSGLSVLTQVKARATVEPDNIPISASDLEPHHIKKLLRLLVTNTDSAIREKVLITLCNSAAFTVNQDIIRNLDGIKVIGAAISDSNPQIKVKALNALNNLSMNLANQEQIKEYLGEICTSVQSSPLNSEVQLAGLRLVINMSVTNNYHKQIADFISCFLSLLVDGNQTTQVHTLKVLVNLSANPSMTKCLLTTKAPRHMTSLFDSCINSDILVRALTFAVNLSENSGNELHCGGQFDYDEDSLFVLLFRDTDQLQKNLPALFQHPDMEVKAQVARLLIKPLDLKR
ncbi:armadillo repeat-containing protein 10 [Bombina bombina]|uniref:armadillo repeat-containing protein 10 n=1 Tax=Bombina bombina TaxID=8345 RepID=UPI00235AF5BD|nr:armadillo repeat-containing protein 10 [Bombina bombina]